MQIDSEEPKLPVCARPQGIIMSQQLLIDATHPEETRAVVVEDGKVREFDYESTNRKQITGNVYLARVVRAEPSLQAVFVEYGGNRHGFLAFSEIHPHYYKIPVADQQPDAKEGAEATVTDSAEADGEAAPEAPVVEIAEPLDSDGSDLPLPVPVPEEAGDPVIATATTDPDELEPDSASDEGASADTSADLQETAGREEISEVIQQNRKLRRDYKVQEVIRQKQLMLVQVIKDERGNKGAALTTYISLAGRYCVLMPNTDRGGGISRKITNVTDRRKLKQIVNDIDVPEGVGLIIRTAGANRTKQEIKRDYEYLIRQWDQIRELTFKSIAPAKIFEDGGLIRRTIRDDYSKGIDEVIVDGDEGYKTAKGFMKLIMPSHAKKVKRHAGNLPLFTAHGVEQFASGLFDPVVQLPSGGYIVIGITEALVAIDVNSGKATLHGTLEQTALQTNLEAAEVIAEQLRLRDLAGLIVIDFIDMEESRHNSAVEKCLKDNLKADRSKIQVGRITGFGLLEMSRQRLRPGLLELSSQPCTTCNGTGLVRARDSLALEVLRQLEFRAASASSQCSIVATVPVDVANIILNQKRGTLAHIENAHQVSVIVEGHARYTGSQVEIRQLETEVLESGETKETVISVETSLQPESDAGQGTQRHDEGHKQRRRRTSRGQGRRGARGARNASGSSEETREATSDAEQPHEQAAQPDDAERKQRGRGRRTRRRSGSRPPKRPDAAGESSTQADDVLQAADAGGKEAERVEEEPGGPGGKPPRRRRRGGQRRKTGETRTESRQQEPDAALPSGDEGASSRAEASNQHDESGTGAMSADRAEMAAAPAIEAAAELGPNSSGQPRRTGWWSQEFQDR